MAGLGFAREQLEKQGWKEGKGLGKEEDGITEAIKLGVKNDTQGVGYKISDQFTFHWWDHIFNKTAKSIVVNENQDGIEVSKSDSKYLPISNQRPNKHSEKALLYGRFVKASASSKAESDSDSDSEVAKDFSTEHTEDIVFKKCGGRTAHKGARHGLKLNGKLKRIEEHDKIAMSEPCSRSTSPDITKEHDIEENAADLLKKFKSKKKKDFKSYSDSEECVKKKKKKRKKNCDEGTSFEDSYSSRKNKNKTEEERVGKKEVEDLKHKIEQRKESKTTDEGQPEPKKIKKKAKYSIDDKPEKDNTTDLEQKSEKRKRKKEKTTDDAQPEKTTKKKTKYTVDETSEKNDKEYAEPEKVKRKKDRKTAEENVAQSEKTKKKTKCDSYKDTEKTSKDINIVKDKEALGSQEVKRKKKKKKQKSED